MAFLCGCRGSAAPTRTVSSTPRDSRLKKFYDGDTEKWHLYRGDKESANEDGKAHLIWGACQFGTEILRCEPAPVIHKECDPKRFMPTCEFRFKTIGEVRSVELEHKAGICYVACDRRYIGAIAYGSTEVFERRSLVQYFKVQVPGEPKQLEAAVTMQWQGDHWDCGLDVNNVAIQTCWTSWSGSSRLVHIPEVITTKGVVNGSDSLDACNRSYTSTISTSTPTEDVESVTHEDDMASKNFIAYADGEYVEYYSWTHHKWMLGIFKGEHALTGGYMVDIVQGQKRLDVHLDSLRAPLQDGELVQVFSKKMGWLSGSISGRQDPRMGTVSGYKVQLSARQGSVIENIPAERVRREFPAGAALEIWRGPSIGWVRALVDKEQMNKDATYMPRPYPGSEVSISTSSQLQLSDFETEEPSISLKEPSEVYVNRKCSKHSKNVKLVRSNQPWYLKTPAYEYLDSHASDMSEPIQIQHASKEPNLSPWIEVRVLEDNSAHPNSATTVPSYLLRRCVCRTYI